MPDTKPLKVRLYEQLRRLRRSGATTPRISELPDLLEVAEALEPDGEPEQRITAALRFAIIDFKGDAFQIEPERGKNEGVLKKDVAETWFGLTADTHRLEHDERHARTADLLHITTASFQTHQAPEILRFLADHLAVRYAKTAGEPADPDTGESPGGTPAIRRVHTKHSRRTPWLILAALLLVVGGSAGAAILLGGSSPPSTPAPPSNPLMEPANFPPYVKGHGAQKMRAEGHYGPKPFAAQTGLIIAQPYGEVEIKLFPGPTSCALWYEGTPRGLEFDIGVNATAETIEDVPVGQPLHSYSLGWGIEHGNLGETDGVDQQFSVRDGIRHPGSVTLTKIDTGYGGLWHGRVTTGKSRSAKGVQQYFAGTFAAEWCNLEPFREEGA
jgi:hypothetical protein